MHLTECLDIAIELNRFDDEVKECLSGFLLKTTTVFHGSEDLNLDPIFGALCFSYSLGGFAFLALKPKWIHQTSFPYRAYGLLLLIVQGEFSERLYLIADRQGSFIIYCQLTPIHIAGPLSFWADYLSMTADSYAHVIDRFMAIVLFLASFWRVATVVYYQRPSVRYAELVSILFAGFFFMSSQDAQVNQDVDGWVFWHTMWHLYPFSCIIIQCTDKFLLNEYNYLPTKIPERTMKTRFPLARSKYFFRLKRG